MFFGPRMRVYFWMHHHRSGFVKDYSGLFAIRFLDLTDADVSPGCFYFIAMCAFHLSRQVLLVRIS